jgi:hypothetical integral membrane protein (TIGR02206 family)
MEMIAAPAFHAFGVAHLSVIFLTIVIPFALAALVRRGGGERMAQFIRRSIALVLVINLVAYDVYVRQVNQASWQQALPFQLCDWAMFVIIVALWTDWRRWFEVAYFWGIGGTLQAVITPNLREGFPDVHFIAFFVGHSFIIIGIVFLMLVDHYRPWPFSIVRTFICTEVYFVVTLTIDLLTGENYGFLLHKPEAFSILSFLSDSWALYLLQMHGVALLFYLILYLPFALWDLIRSPAGRQPPPLAYR